MRWLAAWLALAVCAQAFAVGTAALRGLGHRHGALEIDAKPMVLWRHAGERVATRDSHALAHAAGEAHQHAVTMCRCSAATRTPQRSLPS